MGKSLKQESLWIVRLVDPEDLDLLLSLLVRRPPVPSRPWMDRIFMAGG